MSYKRIAENLSKMGIKERAIELEKLHDILTINKWRIVYDNLMQIVIFGKVN